MSSNSEGQLYCDQPQIPSGNYKDSCKDIEWNPPELKAECKKDFGSSYYDTSLDFGHACKVHTSVSNIQGNLSCDQPVLAQPSGSYIKSCGNIIWTGEVLHAECVNQQSPLAPIQASSLDYLHDCAQGSAVSSLMGRLYCDSPK